MGANQTAMQQHVQPILDMRGITKTFPGVKALTDVNLTVMPAEIHAVVGENGAGKSTLMKVLSGVYPAGTYDGAINFEGQERQFRKISDSEDIGIIIIHQELALVPLLSIAENIFLGHETAKNGIINWFEAFTRTRALLKKVGLDEHPNTLITNIGTGKQQLVEIAKALNKKVKLLILDEPTSSLNEKDSNALLELLKGFKAQGITSILITHKLNEVMKVADRITVIRDGKTIDTMDVHSGEVNEDRIIKAMVGRDLSERYPPRIPQIGDTLLEVKNWSVYHPQHSERQVIKGLNLTVRAGEVVGIAGLMGAGRTEFAMSLFGRAYGTKISGEVLMHGKQVDVSTIPKAKEAGLAYVTEDRKTFGLVLEKERSQTQLNGQMEGLCFRLERDGRRERDDHTLQTTALVHEAYFKLIDQTRIKWQNRAHFFGIAAQAMRRILLEHARQHIADKRGSGNPKISLDAEEIDVSQEKAAELIMLDEALKKLESIDPERSKIVELRYFGGLSIEETAQVLGIGTATVNRSWRVAKAWLYKELSA